ncbi:MAG: YfhO family protein [Coriobacteriia bacterium]|nr:YfhO family protein [Coriobacteriia bacterium]
MNRLRQESKKRISYYLIYSLTFAVLAALVFIWFPLNGKSLIWTPDGVRQHLAAMAYYGQYLRQIFSTLIHTGRFVAPHFDFSIGYGSDLLTTLNWYAIGDPFNLLFAVIPVSKAPYLYSALIVLRLYLIGVAFSAYCHKLKLSRSSQLFGSSAYVFCGFVLQAIVHPNFLNPLIYLPLLLIGVEQIFRKQRPYFFIAVVCLAAITDFYFFYLLTILLIIYLVIRFFTLDDKKSLKSFFSWAGTFALFYLVGLLMACLVFLPIIMYMLISYRAGIHQIISLFYSPGYYLRFFPSFITTYPPGPWTYFGYSALSFAAIILLFTKRKTQGALKFTFILLTVFLMFPIVGDVFNGFSYVTNRWVLGYSFVIALITAVILPDILRPTKKQIVILTIFAAIYAIPMAFAGKVGASGAVPSYLILVLLVLFMWGSYLYHRSGRGKQGSRPGRIALFVALLLMCAGFVINGYYKYAPAQGGLASDYVGSGEAIDSLTKNSSSVVKSIGDTSFYRYDENEYGGQAIIQNRSLLNGVNSTGFYFSLTNSRMIDSLIDDIGLYVRANCSVTSLDNRTSMGTLANVKYFVIRDGEKRYLPYGYDKLVKKANGYEVYKNAYALPFGYTYDKVIPEASYQKLTPVEKQQALLQGAVVNNAVAPSLDTTTPAFNDAVLPYQAQCGAGVTSGKGTFVVTKAGASVTLNFSGLKNCETYLYLKNIQYAREAAVQKPGSIDLSSLSGVDDLYMNGPSTHIPLTISSGTIKKTITYQGPNYSWYANQHDFLVNLGYAAKQKTTITLEFGRTGTYSLDDLQVVCQPISAYGNQVKALKQTTLENVQRGADTITGTVSADKAKLLCLTIPYSKGWSAQVDGKPAAVLNVNTLWCGLYLPAGNHTITLHYETPYFRLGCILSLVGVVLFVVIIVLYERKRRVQRQDAQVPAKPGSK